MRKLALLCLAAALLAVPARYAAQASRERPFIEAAKVETGPRIDGVLDDAVWATATPVESFTQQEPNLGQPATERTEVRILYDSRDYMDLALHWAVFPGLAIFLTVLTINFIGDGLRDALDPRRVL